MKTIFLLGTVAFAILLSSLLTAASVAQTSSVTLGQFVTQLRNAGHELISHGEHAASNNIIAAGHTAAVAANALAAAYETQLDKTFSEIEHGNDQIADELRRLIEALERPLERLDSLVNSTGAVISRLPLSGETPAITSVRASLTDVSNGSFTLELKGFNLEFGDMEIQSELIEADVLSRLSSSIEIAGKLKPNAVEVPDNSIFSQVPIGLRFVKDGGWFSADDVVEYTVYLTVVYWRGVQSRMSYLINEVVRVYLQPQRSSGSHPRVDRSHQYYVRYVPNGGRKIDPESFRLIEWWMHDECQSRNTDYNIERLGPEEVRVFVYGKEEGGFFKECGTRLTYEVQTFREENTEVNASTEWSEFRLSMPHSYPEDSNFVSLELRLRDGSVLRFTEDTSPVEFLKLIDAEEIRQVTLEQSE